MNTQKSSARSRSLIAAVAMLVAGSALAQAPLPKPGAPATEDIRDIRGPKPIAGGWGLALLLAGGVAGVGAACTVWALFRRRRVSTRTPQEIALARLDAARALIRTGNSREYSIELSGITREYIENAFGIIATHLTTDEFLRHFASAPDSVLMGSQKLLGEFLQACDLAKFGGWNMTASAMLEMLESARHFIVGSARPCVPTAQVRPIATDEPEETYDSLPST